MCHLRKASRVFGILYRSNVMELDVVSSAGNLCNLWHGGIVSWCWQLIDVPEECVRVIEIKIN